MWIVIIIAVLVVWQIGIRATAKGVVNGAKRTAAYIKSHKKQ